MDWYAARNQLIALRFIDAVQEALEAILENSEVWPNVPRVAPDLGVRRHLLRKFPHALVYVLMADEVRVLAIAHGRRRPAYWKKRAPR